jgi:hypothetical protein
MDLDTRANLLGAIRLGVGASLVLAPGFAGRIWIGPGADDRGAQVFARAVGARDLILGARLLQAARDKSDTKEFLTLGYLADVADVAATVAAIKSLSKGRRIAMPLIAGAVGALGYAVANATKP